MKYRKYVESDAALERRFQPVMVDEPTIDATIAILRGLTREITPGASQSDDHSRGDRRRRANLSARLQSPDRFLARQGDRI